MLTVTETQSEQVLLSHSLTHSVSQSVCSVCVRLHLSSRTAIYSHTHTQIETTSNTRVARHIHATQLGTKFTDYTAKQSVAEHDFDITALTRQSSGSILSFHNSLQVQHARTCERVQRYSGSGCSALACVSIMVPSRTLDTGTLMMMNLDHHRHHSNNPQNHSVPL